MYKFKTCDEFTSELASKTSVPGGGGASALCAAIAISLGDMVGEFTIGKEKYKDVEKDVLNLMERAQKYRVKMLELIDEDAKAFEPLSRAYSIPKTEPKRDETLEECLRAAMQAPLDIFDATLEIIDLLEEFSIKGSKIILSDAATGASIALGALKGAAINVKVNTKLMKNKEFAFSVNKHIDEKLSVYEAKANKIFDSIYLGL